MSPGLAVKDFARAANWLLDILRQRQPLTEEEERAVDSKIHTLLIEWETWKIHTERRKKKPKKSK